ncbi:P-loop NTPase fold protein [Nonomuraea sp. NPDC023979]|uniref:P-loop NTPase fold protein n=1 Tax=Nonomuraea sp. NPDC023979 TaxID=3154796 RepID=UPI0033E0023C
MSAPGEAGMERAVVRVANGRSRGAGVLVAPDLVVTCAHLFGGWDEGPPTTVEVDFPFLGSGPVGAEVVFWSSSQEGDLAVLRLDAAAAVPGARPVPLASGVLPDQQVAVYGFPSDHEAGVWTFGQVVGPLPSGFVQVQASTGSGFTAGYSGAPVWSHERQAVLGIMVASDAKRQIGLMRSVDSLRSMLPPELDLLISAQEAPPAGDSRGEPEDEGVRGRERTEWVNDAPADHDLLKRAALAGVLARQLRQARTDTPGSSFLVHVDGSWGTGKSTLLKLLAADLRSDSLVVFFDTWRHVRIEPPWWALLTAIRKAVVAARPRRRRPAFLVRELVARVRRDGAPQVVSGLLLVGAALLLVSLFGSGAVGGIEPTLKTATTLLGTLGGLWTAGVLVSRYAMWASARRARSFEESHHDPMNDVAEHLAWLVRHAGRPIVVLIEDLDRCNADYVVNFLDSVQTLLRDVPERWKHSKHHAPSFVVAMDGAWLRCAYENAYETFKPAVSAPGRPLGYLFLDKLFQLSVPMPRLGATSRDQYFGRLLGTAAQPSPPGAERVRAELDRSGDETQVLKVLEKADPEVRQAVASQAVERILDADVQDLSHHALSRFARLFHSNPRAMKRFVNTYTVLRAVRVLEGSVVPTDTLALWTLLRIRWPELADHLEAQPDDITRLMDRSGGDDLPEALRELAASADLHEVLHAVPGAELTPEQIRACSGAGD